MCVDFFGECADLEKIGDGDFGCGHDRDPDAGQDDCGRGAANGDVPHYLLRRGTRGGVFFDLGFDGAKAGADNQHHPGDGGQGVYPNSGAPSGEPRFVGEVRVGRECVPALDAEAGVPCAGHQIKRNEQHSDEKQSGDAAAGDVGLEDRGRQERAEGQRDQAG